jgi:hypothetical protein
MNTRPTKIEIYMYETKIIICNENGMVKTFPRCGITKIEAFVQEMANTGNLDELCS